MTAPSDWALVAAAREGRSDALEELVRRHHATVLALCRALLPAAPEDQAERAAVAVFVRLHRDLWAIEPRRDFPVALLNTAYAALRREAHAAAGKPLPFACHCAQVLRDVLGLDIPTIAAVQDCPHWVVRRRLARADATRPKATAPRATPAAPHPALVGRVMAHLREASAPRPRLLAHAWIPVAALCVGAAAFAIVLRTGAMPSNLNQFIEVGPPIAETLPEAARVRDELRPILAEHPGIAPVIMARLAPPGAAVPWPFPADAKVPSPAPGPLETAAPAATDWHLAYLSRVLDLDAAQRDALAAWHRTHAQARAALLAAPPDGAAAAAWDALHPEALAAGTAVAGADRAMALEAALENLQRAMQRLLRALVAEG